MRHCLGAVLRLVLGVSLVSLVRESFSMEWMSCKSHDVVGLSWLGGRSISTEGGRVEGVVGSVSCVRSVGSVR